jgi:hypothetical protein
VPARAVGNQRVREKDSQNTPPRDSKKTCNSLIIHDEVDVTNNNLFRLDNSRMEALA